ncbi:MAG: efflux transporter outer membrane subunit [Pirellulales bacterium]|nr:efflux transporter outer membrane subunit [Pirellulales bacterium]
MTYEAENVHPADPPKSCRQWAERIGVLSILLVSVLFSGCTTGPREWICNHFKVGPNYAEPAAPIADQWRDGDHPEIQCEATDYSYWWAVFNDPVLNRLVHASYEQNLPLKTAGMRILEARAQLAMVRGNLLPQQQQAVGSFARSQMSGNSYPFGDFALPKMAFDTWSAGFDATWELDFWGRYRRAIESADASLSAQIENYDDVLVILQAEVAATYIQLRTLENRLSLAQKNAALQKKTLRIAQDRFDQGFVSKLDVKQAESILGATESLIPVLETAHRKAQNRLCTLLGLPPTDIEAELGGPGPIPVAPTTVAVGIPAELLNRRPDVRRAERTAAAQCARIGIAESELYPHIAITGTIAYEAEYLNQLFTGNSVTGMVGPGFRWNILNYGRIRNDVRVQDARFGQLVLQYQETVLRANEEVENAITAFLREQVRVKLLERSTKATAEAVELANLQYEEGLIDFQRVVDSERALVLQQDTLAESQGNVVLNLVAVYKALGGGWRMRYDPNRSLEMTPTEAPIEPAPRQTNQPPIPLESLPPVLSPSPAEDIDPGYAATTSSVVFRVPMDPQPGDSSP